MHYVQKQKGIGLVEVIMGTGLIGAALVGIIASFGGLVRVALSQTTNLQAVYMLEEGAEAVRSIRDTDWATFATLPLDTTHYLAWSGTLWEATTTTMQSNGLYRTLTLSEVFRDGNKDIAESGTSDPNTKKIDIAVSWSHNNATTTKALALYLTNVFDE